MSVMTEYPPCRRSEGIAPPTCCQPPQTAERWAAISQRMAARERQLLAMTPSRCGACGSREIAPLFWVGVDVLRCACGAVMSGRGD